MEGKDKRRTFREYVMKYSYSEMRKRRVEKFESKLNKYRSMSGDELAYEYTESEVEYNSKRRVSHIISAILVITIGASLAEVVYNMNTLVYASGTSDECIKLMTWIIFILVSAIMMILIVAQIVLLKDIRSVEKEIMIIEYVHKNNTNI